MFLVDTLCLKCSSYNGGHLQLLDVLKFYLFITTTIYHSHERTTASGKHNYLKHAVNIYKTILHHFNYSVQLALAVSSTIFSVNMTLSPQESAGPETGHSTSQFFN